MPSPTHRRSYANSNRLRFACGPGTPTPTQRVSPTCVSQYTINEIVAVSCRARWTSVTTGMIRSHDRASLLTRCTIICIPRLTCPPTQCAVRDHRHGLHQPMPAVDHPRTHNLPYWDDLYWLTVDLALFTSVSGTAPNRIFNMSAAQVFPGSGQCQRRAEVVRGQTRFDVIYGTSTNGNTSHRRVQKETAPYSVLLPTARACGMAGKATSETLRNSVTKPQRQLQHHCDSALLLRLRHSNSYAYTDSYASAQQQLRIHRQLRLRDSHSYAYTHSYANRNSCARRVYSDAATAADATAPSVIH